MLSFLITFGTKSYLPAETAPEVIIISILDFKFFIKIFSNNFSSLSLKIPPLIKVKRKLLDNDPI